MTQESPPSAVWIGFHRGHAFSTYTDEEGAEKGRAMGLDVVQYAPASGGVDAVKAPPQSPFQRMLAQMVDSEVSMTRAFWRGRHFNATEAEQIDPRPFAEVLKDRLVANTEAADHEPASSPAGDLTGHEAAARYGERGKHRHANLLADFNQSKRMLLACIEDRETRENVAELLMLAERRGADANSEELAALRKSYTALDQLWREAALARTASSPASTDAPLRRVRHVRRGSEYEVLGEGEVQISSGLRGLAEGDRMTVYRGTDGRLWLRFPDEFADGRFVDIP